MLVCVCISCQILQVLTHTLTDMRESDFYLIPYILMCQ